MGAIKQDDPRAQKALESFEAAVECGPKIRDGMAGYDAMQDPLRDALLASYIPDASPMEEITYDDLEPAQQQELDSIINMFYPGGTGASMGGSTGFSDRKYGSSGPGYMSDGEDSIISTAISERKGEEEEIEGAWAKTVTGNHRHEGTPSATTNGSLNNLLKQTNENRIVKHMMSAGTRSYEVAYDITNYDGSKPPKSAILNDALTSMNPAQRAYVDFIRKDYENGGKFFTEHASGAFTAYDQMKTCAGNIKRRDDEYQKAIEAARDRNLQGLPADASSWDYFAAAGKELLGLSDVDDDLAKELFNTSNQSSTTELALTALGIDMNYKEQCYLLAKIIQLAEYKARIVDEGKDRGSPSKKPLPYVGKSGNASIMVNGDPFGFINKLTQSGKFEKFFDIRTSELSELQPYIRLYKVERNYKTGKEFENRISFDSTESPERLSDFFKKKEARGFGVGIKDFTFKYEGSNPFAVKKSISAKLTIHANTFDELIALRTGTAAKYRYLDLCLKTGDVERKKDQTYDDYVGKAMQRIQDSKNYKLDFRLKAVVGWSTPKAQGGVTVQRAIDKQALMDAIDESYITLNLTPTTHEFNIGDDGRVEFVINYLAYVDELFDQPNYNVFGTADLNAAAFLSEIEKKDALVSCNKGISRSAKADEGTLSTWMEELKTSSLQGLIEKLSSRKRIFYARIPRNQLALFTSEGPFYERGGATLNINASESLRKSLKKDLDQLIRPLDGKWKEVLNDEGKATGVDAEGLTFSEWDHIQKEKLMFSTSAINWDEEHVAFFFLSDLIDAVLSNIEEGIDNFETSLNKYMETPRTAGNPPFPTASPSQGEVKLELERFERLKQQFKKLRVVLGPIEIVNPTDEIGTTFLSLGDIPISVKYFVEWLSSKVVGKSSTSYPLSSFLSSFMNNMLRDFLNSNTCFAKRSFQKLRLFNTTITDYELLGTGYDSLTNLAEVLEARRVFLGGSVTDGGDEADEAMVVLGGQTRILNISGPEKGTKGPIDSERNYLIFHAGRTSPTEKMRGIRAVDQSRGIFHYLLGRDRGLIKNISLQRTSTAGHKEVRFEQEGYDGLQQLREVYDVEIDSFANINAWPGTYIFVDPRGFAPTLSYNMNQEGFNFEDLTDYGLGGYYMVITSEHSFGPGYANTKINAKWTHQIDQKADRPAAGGDVMEGFQADDTSTIPNLQNGKGKCSSERKARMKETFTGTEDSGFLSSFMKALGHDDEVSKKPKG